MRVVINFNGQPRKGKSTIMEIMKLTIKEDFRRGTVFSCFLITKSDYLKINMALS